MPLVENENAGAAPRGAAPSGPSLAAQVMALSTMGVPELRARYAEVFGEETRSRNRDWLFRSVAWQVQALAEGGLTERARRRAEELARDGDVRPRRLRPVRGEDAGPGVPRIVQPPPARDARLPLCGAVLVRRYHGQEIRVRVLDQGFEWDGRVFRSLSAVAGAVTGAHWSGVLFFGLKKPGGKEGAP